MPGSNSVSKNGETKLCKGPLHREGTRLPLKRFYKAENGNPYSQCIACRNYLLGRLPDAGLISWHDAEPVFTRLIEIAGSKKHAAEILGLSDRANVFRGNSPRVKVSTFNLVRKRLSELERGKLNQGDSEVVLAEPLGFYIRDWERRWLADRPRYSKQGVAGKRVKGEFYGPISWLSEHTKLHPSRIEQIKEGQHPRVPLWQADRILSAMGEEFRFHEDIKVIPNPNWSMERWLAHMQEKGCI